MPWLTSTSLQVLHQVSDLLSLSPEIRNTIWQMALCSEEPFTISDNYKVPGLLATSRQTRTEGVGIFHTCNTFRHIIHDMDASTLHRWVCLRRNCRTTRDLVRKAGDDLLCLQGGRHWADLKRWLDIIQDKRKCSINLRIVEGTDAESMVQEAARVQAIAIALRGQPKDVYEAAME